TLVGTIGMAVTLTIFIAIPCGYFFVEYRNLAHEMDYKSKLAAARVAKYVYMHQSLWQYQGPRLAELIELGTADGKNFSLNVRDDTGAVIAGAGPALDEPVMTRANPIVVSGAVIGRVEGMSSLHPLLWETGLAALLSAIFGIGIYFAVRVFPLKVLDNTVGALETAKETIESRNAQLNVQNERFDTALTNMSQGLCMFDKNRKLVISNPRFAEIYGLPAHAVKPGMTTPELMAFAAASGGASDADPAATLAMRESIAREGKPGTLVQRLTDGRNIAISYRPMPSGGFVVTFEDISERLLAEEKIKHLAHYDALTDLPNRVTFYDRLGSVLSHLRRSESIAVLSLDLDHFKNVNDTLGHPVGDRLLQAAAERMRSCVRVEDIVARLGGDEFAIGQVPCEQGLDVTILAQRLIEVVGAPYDIDGHQVVVGVSVGIAIAPHDGTEPDSIMKNADLALYRAKADGGGLYRFFEIEMDERMRARHALELDLRKAIVNGEFELYYQPIIDVKSSQITSFEALIRWHHPERGMIPPLDFIPIAEETGLIVQIGEWVLRQACTEAARWPTHVTIAVNLSPAQFKSRNLVPMVINALATSGLPATRLELEITEMVLVQENDGAFAILHQLRDLGIRIAMDDFGTGYSSLGYLRSFPFNKIKIDQSFIRDLPGKQDSLAIVRAVVGLSSSLGITTTAEGVETGEQLASVTAEGCTEAQGYLYSWPKPAADVMRILAEQGPKAEAVA
ncbi:MAG: EAL domain-containing protein, partial [Pseudolabrys sp.]|nr:EAL domain-containing protein [Pseudolabrys sp.]